MLDQHGWWRLGGSSCGKKFVTPQEGAIKGDKRILKRSHREGLSDNCIAIVSVFKLMLYLCYCETSGWRDTCIPWLGKKIKFPVIKNIINVRTSYPRWIAIELPQVPKEVASLQGCGTTSHKTSSLRFSIEKETKQC